MIRRVTSICLLIMLASIGVGASTVNAAAPAWQALAAPAPTHLPLSTDEIQMVAVDAEAGSFSLSFEGDATPSLPFDAAAPMVEAALNALPSIGGSGGSVQATGGPGSPGAPFPYVIRFGGSLAATDTASLVPDSSGLGGGAATAAVTTRANGSQDGKGTIAIFLSNVGGAPTDGSPAVAEFDLPLGLSPVGTAQCPALAQHVVCSSAAEVVPPGKTLTKSFLVPVTVTSDAPTESVVSIEIGGGGALPHTITMPVILSQEPAPAGIQTMWAGAFDANGLPEDRAGAHPERAGAGFLMNTVLSSAGVLIPAGDLRDLDVMLPPGFIGNPMVTKRCPQFLIGSCPGIEDTGLGWASPFIQELGNAGAEQVRISNSEPPYGFAAQFAFKIIFNDTSIFPSLRSDSDYGVTIGARNVSNTFKIYGAVNVLEGQPPGAEGKAFLTNPTNCSETGPFTAMTGRNWQQSDAPFREIRASVPVMTECSELEFAPDFKFQPREEAAATGTSAEAMLTVDQTDFLDPDELAPPHLKKSLVALPEGMVLNPSAANGLEACSTQQIGLKGTKYAAPNPIRFSLSPATCPDNSKIGTVEVVTPLLEEPLEGTVFLAAQDDNPFKSLLAMYLVVEDDKTGITIKLPGKVTPSPVTGQLVAEFDNNPQTPFEVLKLQFRGGGPRSTMATPDVCGAYTTNGEFTPWSAPESGPPAQTKDSFEITSGVGGSAACPRTKAERPFKLGFEAGSTNAAGGADSPFTLRITRPDGNQELDRITVSTPPGLIASLRGIAMCSEAQLAAAQAPERTGKQEMASPSCPASSQVGTTTIGAGVGSSPIYVKTGKVYLSGPYKGAPLSLAFVVPAVAGPFDLGVQVVRTALRINPKTAQVTAESDSIPQILKGIPLLVRDVRVDLDRPGFVRNPTNCEPMAVSGQVTGGSGAVDNLASRFQVGNCGALGFKPQLKIQLKGGTKRNKYQQLTAKLTARPGDANIAGASVRFPQSIFLAQNHIRTICTRVQFAAETCPAGSVYGYAEAVTPLLDQPLQGPVYLRSSDNPLPDLVAALRGPNHQPIKVELAGRTDSKNRGLRNTFDVVPDAPVSEFTLRMRGGKKSLLVTSRNICLRKERADVRLRGQNGMQRNLRPVIQVNCKNKKQKKQKNSRRGKKSR